MNLKAVSSRRGILFYDSDVRESGFFHILSTVWEMHPFKHLETTLGGHAPRLSKLYSKLLVWQLPVALNLKEYILMDSDIMIKKDIGELYHFVPRCEIAAIMRGGNDLSLMEARQSHTIGLSSNEVRGGINSGIVVLEPSLKVFRDLIKYMRKDFKPRPHGGGAEQDLI